MLQTPVKKGGSGCLRPHAANLLPAGSTKISADGNLASKLARLAGEADSIRYLTNFVYVDMGTTAKYSNRQKTETGVVLSNSSLHICIKFHYLPYINKAVTYIV